MVVGCDTPAQLWDEHISRQMFDFGWRDGTGHHAAPSAESPTLDVLRLLAGTTHKAWRIHGVNTAVAAATRASIRK